MKRVVKSGVKTEVETADINRQDKDIYINLFNIYKKQIENKPFFEKIKTISSCRENEEYQKMSLEAQEKLFKDLMSLK